MEKSFLGALRPIEALPDIINSSKPLSLNVLIDRYHKDSNGFQSAQGHLCRKGKDGAEEVLACICSVSPPCLDMGIHYRISPWNSELNIGSRTLEVMVHYLGEKPDEKSGWTRIVLSNGGRYGT